MTLPIIVFHTNEFSYRGTEVALFDYALAHKNRGGKCMIIAKEGYRTKKNYLGNDIHCQEVEDNFVKKFGSILTYTDMKDLPNLLKLFENSILYRLIDGERDDFPLVLPIKIFNHCVFNSDNPRCDFYISISNSVSRKGLSKTQLSQVLPHIVNPHPIGLKSLREELKIPKDAIVFGRHGGFESFDIEFVKKNIFKMAKKLENVYFLFLGTEPFNRYLQDNIIFLPATGNKEYKYRFIETCDVMIHARKIGESFGLSIAEFSMAGKPVISYVPHEILSNWKKDPINGIYDKLNVIDYHVNHIEILGENGFYFSFESQLLEIMFYFIDGFRVSPESLRSSFQINPQDYKDLYNQFSEKNVMDKFYQIISPEIKKVENVRIINLKHRADRMDYMISLMKKMDIKNYSRIDAINGKILSETNPNTTKNLLTHYTLSKNVPQVLGCALSHMKAWKECIGLQKPMLIFEDDVKIPDIELFKREVKINTDVRNESFDIIFLGYHLNKNVLKNGKEKDLDKLPSIITLEKSKELFGIISDPFGIIGGGCHSYLIFPSGAKKLLQFIATESMFYPIDYLILFAPLRIGIYSKSLATSPHPDDGEIDSDIQIDKFV